MTVSKTIWKEMREACRIVQVTGEPDVGKTTFALTCGIEPKDILFVDDDVKGSAIVSQIGKQNFFAYHNLVAEGKDKREVDLHEHVRGLFREVGQSKSRPKLIVFDTWTRFAKTCHPVVVKFPNRFREFWNPMGKFKGPEQWQASFALEAQILDELLGLCEMLVVTSHLKDQYLEVSENRAVKTGKQVPDVQKTVIEKANLRLWLRHSQTPQPTGLVLKRIAKFTATEEGVKPVSVLPRRISPCTWERIAEYWQQPVGDRALTVEETPDEFELSILDGTLTEDQKQIFKVALQDAEVEAGMAARLERKEGESGDGSAPKPKSLPELLREKKAQQATQE